MTTRIFLPLALAATALPLLLLSPVSAEDGIPPPVDSQPIPVPAAPITVRPTPAPGTDDPEPIDAAPDLPVPPAAGEPAPAAPPVAGAPIPPAAPPVVAAPGTGFDATIAERDAHTLNPLLNPTDAELQSFLAAGRAIGDSKDDFLDVLAPSRRAFQFRKGGILGEVRRETGVAYWITPGTEARWRGLLEQRSFADTSQQQADFSALQQLVVSPQRTVTFIVELGDLVQRKKKDPPITQTQADDALSKLTGVRFVLSDDKGTNYNPRDVISPTHTILRQEYYDSIAPNPDKVPGASTGVPSPVTATRVVKRREPLSDYAAFYTVTFDAYNMDGTARINRDTKSVTLRIILPEEPKYAVFDLKKIP